MRHRITKYGKWARIQSLWFEPIGPLPRLRTVGLGWYPIVDPRIEPPLI